MLILGQLSNFQTRWVGYVHAYNHSRATVNPRGRLACGRRCANRPYTVTMPPHRACCGRKSRMVVICSNLTVLCGRLTGGHSTNYWRHAGTQQSIFCRAHHLVWPGTRTSELNRGRHFKHDFGTQILSAPTLDTAFRPSFPYSTEMSFRTSSVNNCIYICTRLRKCSTPCDTPATSHVLSLPKHTKPQQHAGMVFMFRASSSHTPMHKC